jgi:ankyrin repeat protein
MNKRTLWLLVSALTAPAPALSQPASLVCEALAQKLAQSHVILEGRHLNEALFQGTEVKCEGIVADLLTRGASVVARNRKGESALSVAAKRGSIDVASLLISTGADIHHRDLYGATPLLLAAEARRTRMVKYLLDAGADVNAQNKQGITPLAAAAFNGDSRMVSLLIEAGAEPDRLDESGKVALIYAAGKADTRIVSQLLAAGADADGVWGNDLTPLMWAAGHANDAPRLVAIETAELLLEAGADLSRVDNRGRSALMIAASRGHTQMVRFLIGKGATMDGKDRSGKSAYDLATNDELRTLLSR